MAKASGFKSPGKAKQRIVGTTVLIAIFIIIMLILPSQNDKKIDVLQPVEIPPKPESLNVQVLPIEIPEPPTRKDPPEPVAVAEAKQPERIENSSSNTSTDSLEKKSEEQPPQAVTIESNAAETKPEKWVIQVGSFSSRANAEELLEQLRADNYKVFLQEVESEEGKSFRVNVGPNPDKSKLLPFKDKLEKILNNSAIIKAYQP